MLLLEVLNKILWLQKLCSYQLPYLGKPTLLFLCWRNSLCNFVENQVCFLILQSFQEAISLRVSRTLFTTFPAFIIIFNAVFGILRSWLSFSTSRYFPLGVVYLAWFLFFIRFFFLNFLLAPRDLLFKFSLIQTQLAVLASCSDYGLKSKTSFRGNIDWLRCNYTHCATLCTWFGRVITSRRRLGYRLRGIFLEIHCEGSIIFPEVDVSL